MKICDFTQSQLDYFEIMCNFTPEEKKLFDLRAKDVSLEDCGEIMHRTLDSVKQLSRKVNKKIQKEM